ncbi:hypothetical protein SAMN05216480_101491 [Pustulibacterium marinum]|uniref:Uncharacterized protein n=1 Tax=Pustulibacterium marinum TaxID=1224947 RepID=A0A1I7F084_9FLAO|nr:hypothetical protein [Pustulibacterium marinum]SFU29557.1 hypothetical protein SAMN05216480_101491 [Pustulibacterium marinum]
MTFYDKNKNVLNEKLTRKGPLGLLALGDIGVREWKKAKKEEQTNKDT